MGEALTARPQTRRAALALSLAGLAVLVTGCGNDARNSPSVAFDDCATTTSGPASIVGFDPETGEQRWTRLAGAARFSDIDVAGVLVAFGSRTIGYDPATGQALWCRAGSRFGSMKPATVEGNFVVITGDAVESVDATTGQTIWSTDVDAPSDAELVSDGSQIVVTSGSILRRPAEAPEMPKAVIARLDARTGAMVDGPDEEPWLEQGDENSAVVITESFNTVVVSDPATGQERWRVSNPFTTSVILDGDLLFVSRLGSGDSKVTAHAASDGAVVWESTIPGPSVFVSGDIVFSAQQAGLVALDRGSGRLLWDATFDTIGRDERYSEPGWFAAVAVSEDGSAAAGSMIAAEPYND